MADDKSGLDEGVFVHLFVLIAIVVSGLYVIQHTSEDKTLQLMENIMEDNNIKLTLISQLNAQLKALPYQLKLFAIMGAIRALSDILTVWYIPLAGVCIGFIESKIKKSTIAGDHSPSVTAYHAAKKMVPVALLYLSIAYIVIPFELMLTFDTETVKYVYALINAAFSYYVFFTMNMHKPPQI